MERIKIIGLRLGGHALRMHAWGDQLLDFKGKIQRG